MNRCERWMCVSNSLVAHLRFIEAAIQQTPYSEKEVRLIAEGFIP